MLQQTQVQRVLPKYKLFLTQFPTATALSTAKLRDVLEVWSGLGYNRRAKHLHQTACTVVHEYGGRFPKTFSELLALPGVGTYTAGAVCAFAYNIPVPILETNIRTIITHHFFRREEHVTDTQLLAIAEELLDREHPREWYWAMMDYGTYLKTNGIRTNAKSSHYRKQSAFKGSNREIRGKIMRTLLQAEYGMTRLELAEKISVSSEEVRQQLTALKKEGLLENVQRRWRVRD